MRYNIIARDRTGQVEHDFTISARNLGEAAEEANQLLDDNIVTFTVVPVVNIPLTPRGNYEGSMGAV